VGAKNTVCKTASGLTAKGQASTARDLAVMFRHFMQDPAFASRMKQVKVKTSYGSLLRNHNKALWQVEGTQGGKTGFTNAARQTYVGKFKRGDQEIVIAVMGCETMWADVKKLVQHGFSLQDRLTAAAPHRQLPCMRLLPSRLPDSLIRFHPSSKQLLIPNLPVIRRTRGTDFIASLGPDPSQTGLPLTPGPDLPIGVHSRMSGISKW